jgi:hypothetical protein
MANSFLDLPMPVGVDGPGAAVDTSAMGKDKTIIVGGVFTGATVTVQVSNDGGTTYRDLTTFSSAGKKPIPVAAEWMRVWVRGRSAEPFSANCDVGANDNGSTFAVLNTVATDGASAPVDISALGNFTTMVVGGEFRDATLTVEVSEDGNSYHPVATFKHPGGVVSKEAIVGNWARVVTAGRTGNTFPFTPTVAMGAANDPGAGGIAATGETLISTIRAGEGDSHDSDTPLVVSQFQFNPLDYAINNTTRTLKFRAVAANGGGAALTQVQLYNLTDGEAIATLNFVSATPTAAEVALTEGPLAGQIDQSAKVYEVRIWVDTPDAVDDTIELGSAELQVINTVD